VAPPAGTIRPWRYLATFVGIVVVLYALVFFTGDRQLTPKLGIDLEGGTRVTLTARTATGQPPTKDQLNLAREIIDQRVNGLGVSGAEVVQDGSNLTITVPGDQGQRAKDLAQTAQLRFRAVLAGPFDATPQPAPGTPAPGGAAPGGSTGGTPGQPNETNPGQPGPAGQPGGPTPGGVPGPGSAAPHGVVALPLQSPHPHAPAPPTPPTPTPAPPAAGTGSDAGGTIFFIRI